MNIESAVTGGTALRNSLGALADCGQFFMYRMIWNESRGKYADKHPTHPSGAYRISPKVDWSSFDEIEAAAVAANARCEAGVLYAVGIWLTRELHTFFFDMDAFAKPYTPPADLLPCFSEFAGAMVEWSSSTKGAHIIGRYTGELPNFRNKGEGATELYIENRGIALSPSAEGCADTDHTVALHKLAASRFQVRVAAPVAAATDLIAVGALMRERERISKAGHGERNHVLNSAAFLMGGYVAAGRIARAAVVSGLLDATVVAGWDNHDKTERTLEQAIDSGEKMPIALGVPLAPDTAVNLRNGAALMQQIFPPVRWALQGLIPQGTAILSAQPKAGKSWLVLQACIAVAAGVPLWPGRDAEIAGDTLYLDLEGNDRRLQERIAGLLKGFPDGVTLERFHFETEWPRAAAGVVKLREFLIEHPECRLIVIDTLATWRDTDPGRMSAYAADYAVGEMLKPLTREFPVAILLVTHTRKMAAGNAMDKISGTQGLVGGVDNYLMLERGGGTMDAELIADGRDIKDRQELALRARDNGGWVSVGNAIDVKRSSERQDVLKAVVSLGGVGTPRDIHAALEERVALATLYKRLGRMVQAGDIIKSGKLYTLTTMIDHGLKLPQLPGSA